MLPQGETKANDQFVLAKRSQFHQVPLEKPAKETDQFILPSTAISASNPTDSWTSAISSWVFQVVCPHESLNNGPASNYYCHMGPDPLRNFKLLLTSFIQQLRSIVRAYPNNAHGPLTRICSHTARIISFWHGNGAE